MGEFIDPEEEHGPDGVSGMIRDFTRRHGLIPVPQEILDAPPLPQTMGFIGDYGLIEAIDCTVEPEAEVVFDEHLLIVPPAETLEDWVPTNCPRRPDFNASLGIGCMTCSHSIIDYKNGMTSV